MTTTKRRRGQEDVQWDLLPELIPSAQTSMRLLPRRMGNRVITGPRSQDLDGYSGAGHGSGVRGCDIVFGDAHLNAKHPAPTPTSP